MSWPVHVTVRMRRDVPRLRNFDLRQGAAQGVLSGLPQGRIDPSASAFGFKQLTGERGIGPPIRACAHGAFAAR
jgi:hypothetical protein